ncbi:MAG: efflux RND transporter periplasmic adaptor subunit [Ignavibacteriales bacterium]|nr:efflux RND transporter periplasmic adaptor subunit [Ignavibacteriales bacterium]
MAKLLRVTLVLTVLSCSLGFLSCSSKSNEGPAQRAGGRPGGMTVSGVVVTSQPLDNVVNSSGTVLASESVDLAAEASGIVQTITFKEGAHVRKNDLLLKLNCDDLQAQLKKTELQIQLAADQAERQKRLLETGNTSKEQHDVAISMLATLNADRENLVASIRKREIRAPFDGIVGLRYVSEGSYVAPTTRIASVQKINPLKVDFAIPEKYAGKVRVGDLVKLQSDETNLQFMGKVYAIEPEIEPATRTVQLRALCENKSEAIYPGGYVHVELRLKQPGGALMVPTQAIIPVLKGQTVLVKKNGVVVSVSVKTGVRTPSVIQIISGLSEGDTVLTTGILQLRPGMPVNVTVNQ